MKNVRPNLSHFIRPCVKGSLEKENDIFTLAKSKTEITESNFFFFETKKK